MKPNATFDPQRFWQLFRIDLLVGKRNLFFAALGAAGIYLAAAHINAIEGDLRFPDHLGWFVAYALIGSYLIASTAVNEFLHPKSRHAYLLLPASNFEKFLSKYLSSLIWIILLCGFGFWLLIHLTSWTLSFYGGPIEGSAPSDFSFRAFVPSVIIKIILVLHPVVLMGAFYFNRFATVQIAATAFVVGWILFGIGFLIVQVVLWDKFGGWVWESQASFRPSNEFEKWAELSFFPLVVDRLVWLIPIIFALAGYFKLKEKQA